MTNDEILMFKAMFEAQTAELNRVARELASVRQLVSEVVNYAKNAESEVPEYMRRFANYMHDLHDIRYMYEEQGHEVPQYLHREMERCDDRMRQLLDRLNKDGAAFEKVRREMAADPLNRWDHTRLLTSGAKDESRKSE